MRILIALCLALALANAEKLGYNYQPVDSGIANLSPSIGPIGQEGPQDLGISSGPIGGDNGGSFGPAPSLPAGPEPSLSGPAPGNNYAAPVELQKEFFTYTADEGAFEDTGVPQQAANNLRKGLRVIFIKGPENRGLENAALSLAKQAAQQETAIYVLNKQADISDLANKLNNIGSSKNSKPEVHFVKYRTSEDAANAQRAIQGQYDQLGGKSVLQDGGVAPVLNFASRGPALPAAPVGPAPDNSYLPASVFRRRL